VNQSDPRFLTFVEQLRARTLNAQSESDSRSSPEADEAAFTMVFLESLQDLGQVADFDAVPLDVKVGRLLLKASAWSLSPHGDVLGIFAAIHSGSPEPQRVPPVALRTAAERALRVVRLALEGAHERLPPATVARDMFSRIHDASATLSRVHLTLLVDGVFHGELDLPPQVQGLELQKEVWDLQRLYRASAAGLPYEPISIDLVGRLGEPLRCVRAPHQPSGEYESFLAVIPGELLYRLYHEFGPRLLELNVRSFLQARGKVNSGIRRTLRERPARFMAYNNGLSATVESLELTHHPDGGLAISQVTGLQVVNGGQTVASIHRARDTDGVDLSEVFVQAKITKLDVARTPELVKGISEYSNTQNRVNTADLSANDSFQIRMEQLAGSVWTPGQKTKWFYERARGAYTVARSRAGTKASIRAFDELHPRSQRLDKVGVAKYVNAWGLKPHVVGMGGQKNFIDFRKAVGGFRPDEAYFRDVVAKALLYKAAEKAARQHKLPAYRANAVAYTIALLSHRAAGRLDLSAVWQRQSPSAATVRTINDWLPVVHETLIASAGDRNVTEWCKKPECWTQIRMLSLTWAAGLEGELGETSREPTVGKNKGGLTPADREAIARVMLVSQDEWIHLARWAHTSGEVKPWLTGLAASLAGYAAADWADVPSKKQAQHACKLLSAAERTGARLSQLADE